ncbi:MAG: FeoA family protein [Candidatus Omnitrophota bacterium]|jgi:Fe2+ transport system protein FeoA
MKKLALTHIKANKKYKIVDVAADANLKSKLMSMGVYPGKEIIKLSHIGLKGPVVIKAGRSMLALGHSMAAKIVVEA